jgi:hypothetical protein
MGEHPGMMSLTQTAFGHACLAGGRAVDAVAYARSALSQHTTAGVHVAGRTTSARGVAGGRGSIIGL